MRSLWWWLRGKRPDVGSDDVPLGYARDQVPMLVALAGLLAVETAVVGLLVPFWWVHVLDVLALWQVLGIAAGLVTHPHVVRRDELVLRHGRRVLLTVPLTAVEAVRLERRYHGGKVRQRHGDELAIVVGNQTDVLLELSGTIAGVRRVRFRADDPHAARDALTSAVARM